MHIIAFLTLIIIIVFFTYEGYRNGLYQSTYLLLNHLIGFLVALTFAHPLAGFIQNVIPALQTPPMPEYLVVISVALLFGVTRGAGSFLRTRFTVGGIDGLRLVDRIGGSVLGLTDGVVISGFTLILLALMPFMPYIPGDFGRIRTRSLPVDTGAIMLRFYALSAHKMSGNRPFLLEGEPILKRNQQDGLPDGGPGVGFEDINNNGKWDRGWMWEYRHHADFTVGDVVKARGKRQSGPPDGEGYGRVAPDETRSSDGFPDEDVGF